ncbi:MAG TPA: hypothetical protein VJH92_06315 [Candidatus Nanoarchaeia archaeon]|nr:hypothetical protein [Candidatus Nanoarchaeia archaeon]
MAKKDTNKIGSWAFLIGLILAILFALFGTLTYTVVVILVLVGIIVGLFNISDEETGPFLMSGVVLIIASSLGGRAVSVIDVFDRIFNALLLIFTPATIIVAIKNVFGLAKR